MECSITNPALLFLKKHLAIGHRQKAPKFSAFHWSPHGSLVSIGQHFVTTRVVHLPKKDRNKLNCLIGPKRTKSPNQTRLCGSCITAIAGCETKLCLLRTVTMMSKCVPIYRMFW